MQINVFATLQAGPNRYIGSTNMVVFETKSVVELTPKMLEEILERDVEFRGVHFSFWPPKYVRFKNMLILRGDIESTDSRYLKRLVARGWKPHVRGLKYHKIEFPAKK